MAVHSKPGFDERFRAMLDKHRRQPFVWGKSDCVCIALDAVHARSGKWLAKRTWKDETSAKAALKTAGFADVEAAIAAHLEEIPVIMAQRGDIGVIDLTDGGKALVVCTGGRWFGKAPRGPLALPLMAPRRAFAAS